MVSWTVDVVGAQTLEKFQQLWIKKGTPLPKPKKEVNVFKFGNGHREVSETRLAMPVGIGGRRGTICAAVVRGDAPLLISRPALKTLQANLNFGGDSLTLISDKLEVPVTLNSAGQYSVDVLDFPSPIKPEPFTDVPTSGAQMPVAKEDNPQSQGSDLNNSMGPHLQPLNKSVGPDSPTLNNDNATSSRPTGHEVMSASRKVGKPEVSLRNKCFLPKHRSRRDGVNWVRSIW